MPDQFISFYLAAGRIHIQAETLRQLDRPAYIHFLVSEDGKSMIMEPYPRKVFSSVRVPKGVYEKTDHRVKMEFKCAPLCHIMAEHLNWLSNKSYRIRGKLYPKQQIVKFDLTQTELISADSKEV